MKDAISKKKYINKVYVLEEIPGKLKKCSACDNLYPQITLHFSKHFNYPSGLFHKCKYCCRVKKDENFWKHYKNRVAINLENNTQICKVCEEELPLNNEYYRIRNDIPSGFSRVCKNCDKETINKSRLLIQSKLKDNLWECSSCKEIFPLTKDYFYKRSDYVTGFQNRCKKCVNKNPCRYNRYSDNENLELYLKDILNGIKNRSKTKKLAFDLTSEFLMELYIKQQGLCIISKKEMTFIRGTGKVKTNISVDRIIPSLGYIKSNVQFLCSIINYMKCDMNMEELKYYCNLITQNNE